MLVIRILKQTNGLAAMLGISFYTYGRQDTMDTMTYKDSTSFNAW